MGYIWVTLGLSWAMLGYLGVILGLCRVCYGLLLGLPTGYIDIIWGLDLGVSGDFVYLDLRLQGLGYRSQSSALWRFRAHGLDVQGIIGLRL